MSLYFKYTKPDYKDISNFDLEDEIYYDMDIHPDATILATAYTPKAIDTKGREIKRPNSGRRVRSQTQGRQHLRYPAADLDLRERASRRRLEPSFTSRSLEQEFHAYRRQGHDPAWHSLGCQEKCGFARRMMNEDNLIYVEGGVPRPEKLPDS